MESLDALVERSWRDCVLLAYDTGPPSSSVASYALGHPYLPDDRDWPTWRDRPMCHVLQLDFGALPPLAGFPERGLLQWFVGADSTYGLTFDDTAGRVGFAVRWHPDPAAPSLARPDDPTPWHTLSDAVAPLEVGEGPVAVHGTAARTLPAYTELGEGRDLSALAGLAESVGEDPDETEFVWEEYVRGPSGDRGAASGSMLGGAPSFTQWDPRGWGGYPAASLPAGRQLVQLDSEQFGGWGDAGIAHLFGDPAALARGDLSGVTYHWDCG